jgi:hypothetical protein
MSVPATEIAVLTLRPDTAIEDASTPAGHIFNQMLKTVKSQAGFQRQCWGRQLENPNHLVLITGKHSTLAGIAIGIRDLTFEIFRLT